jgi:EAL domain-containing protein (putative c-di-GMP-specific phosphodiesterase class I)
MHLETRRLDGFEALVRWRHPVRGIIPPDEFIPAAEETGLILPLGRWILGESCRQLREWQRTDHRASPLMMSVNLSCKQFLQSDLVEQVDEAVQSTGLDARSLKLEITESYLIENSEKAIKTMNRLRLLGVEISLDDFGTGYSSLSYLHRLPVNSLKIDRSFIGRMTESEENYEIVRTIIKLAQNLKMQVVAEGIETAEQLAQLNSLNCDFGQGYFFSKPLEPVRAALFIGENIENLPTIGEGPALNSELNM